MRDYKVKEMREGSYEARLLREVKNTETMNEKEFMQDVFDVLLKNDRFITQEQFYDKYEKLFIEYDPSLKVIRLGTDREEWLLSLQKTWCDNTKTK